MKRTVHTFVVLGFGCIALGFDCMEDLPAYDRPENVYTIAYSVDQPDLESVRRDTFSVCEGKAGLGFSVDVTNVFDETLSDTVADPLGEITIWWESDPTIMRTLLLNDSHEVLTDEIDCLGNLNLDPEETIRFAVNWLDWRDDLGKRMWSYLPYPSGTGYIEFPAMTFASQARIQLFSGLPAVYSEIVRFNVTFYHEPQVQP